MTDTPAQGAAPQLELETAIALADANEASGFPAPPHVAAVIEAASPAEIKSARKAMETRRKAAEAAEAAKAAEQPTADVQPPPPPAAGADQIKE